MNLPAHLLSNNEPAPELFLDRCCPLHWRAMVPATEVPVHQGHSGPAFFVVTWSAPFRLVCQLEVLTTFVGNELDIWWQDQLGETDFRWMAQYGNAWRIGGCFGV